MNSAIACEHITRSYAAPSGVVIAVRDLSLGVRSGELVALLGASGSGKTTVLGLLGGLDQPSSGRILIEGRDLAELDEATRLSLRRRKVGFVFQAAGLMPLMTACENVALALEVVGADPKSAKAMAMRTLERVGVLERARHRTYELSGGEQARVALARALVKSPVVLLADEPTGQLDSETGATIFALLRQVAASGTAVLMATHDEVLANQADRAKTLVDGVLSNSAEDVREHPRDYPGPVDDFNQ
jgi:putative ABC transport system ATP-binding protein